MAIQVTGFGPIEHFQVPPGWHGPYMSRPGDMRQRQEFFSDTVPGGAISLFYRGLPIEVQAAKLFKTFLESTPAPGTRELADSEKASLSEILGPRNAGSNQFTQPEAPVFDLDSAKVGWLGKHSALFVRGRFNQSDEGQENSEFCGVFLPSGPHGREIFEIFLQAPGLQSFEKCSADFESTLQSLVLR